MIWGAYGAQNSSQGGMRRRDASENDIHVIPNHRRSEDIRPSYQGTPPAGFEPALTDSGG